MKSHLAILVDGIEKREQRERRQDADISELL